LINGHKSSVSLEEAFWTALKEIARAKQQTLSDLVSAIDRDRKTGNLSSSLRLYALAYYWKKTGGNETSGV
jgi:predicted DNA-binding ribbon-helix-helix protein